MGLSGSLEDMPLQDILQIIHHSKKSGTLYLSGTRGEGTIVFKEGSVVQSFSPLQRIDIGKALLERGRISAQTLKDAVAAQNRDSQGQRLGSILVDRGAVRFEDIEEVVKKQIQSALNELLTWADGSFNLVLEDVPLYDSIAVALDELALPRGLDTQHLLLEALRTWDEQGRDADAGEPPPPAPSPISLAPPPAPGPAAADPDGQPLKDAPRREEGVPVTLHSEESLVPRALATLSPLVMVTLDRELAARVFDHFRDIGFPVETSSDANDALPLLSLFSSGELRPTLLLDPDSAGPLSQTPAALIAGIKKTAPSVPIIAIGTEVPAETVSALYRAGARNVLDKPVSDDHVDAFMAELTGILAGIVKERAPSAPVRPPAARRPEPSPDVEEVRRLIEELRAQRETAAMTLSLLKVLSRRFDRAIFFYVQDADLMPLGAFGVTGDGASVAVTVRDLSVPLTPGSPFALALASGRSYTVSTAGAVLDPSLMECIGPPRTDQACLLPLVADERQVAILYCDQGRRDAPLGNVQGLEPLLEQAARSFDDAIASGPAFDDAGPGVP